MKRLLVVSCLLFTASCTEPEESASRQEIEPLPEYVQAVQGANYQGVIFTAAQTVVPGYEEHGVVDLARLSRLPAGAAFRRATEAEVAVFEAMLPSFWERRMNECPGGDCPYAPGTSGQLGAWRRQYVGYNDSTGAPGVWVNFYPMEYHDDLLVGPHSDWVLMPAPVEDGGPAFFNLLYSVGRDSVLSISFNRH